MVNKSSLSLTQDEALVSLNNSHELHLRRSGRICRLIYMFMLLSEFAVLLLFSAFLLFYQDKVVIYLQEHMQLDDKERARYIAASIVVVCIGSMIPSQICGWIGVLRYNLGCLYARLAMELFEITVSLLVDPSFTDKLFWLSQVIPLVLFIHRLRLAKLEMKHLPPPQFIL